MVSGDRRDIGRQYILSSLNADHFNQHWDTMCNYYRMSLDYLYDNHFLVSQKWLPYENMLIPMILFLSKLPNNDFTQMNDLQRRFLKFWYWSVTFSQRYSSASLETILIDSSVLMRAAQGDYSFDQPYFKRFEYVITSYYDLLTISKKPNAVYKGVLNLMNLHSGGIRDWKNNNLVTFTSASLEDHHIFPLQYLSTKFPDVSETVNNSVLNRTLIPKITNIKIGKQPPSEYLREMFEANPDLPDSLGKHFIPSELLDGDYDDKYNEFLEDRGKLLMDFLNKEIVTLKQELEKELVQRS